MPPPRWPDGTALQSAASRQSGSGRSQGRGTSVCRCRPRSLPRRRRGWMCEAAQCSRSSGCQAQSWSRPPWRRRRKRPGCGRAARNSCWCRGWVIVVERAVNSMLNGSKREQASRCRSLDQPATWSGRRAVSMAPCFQVTCSPHDPRPPMPLCNAAAPSMPTPPRLLGPAVGSGSGICSSRACGSTLHTRVSRNTVASDTPAPGAVA